MKQQLQYKLGIIGGGNMAQAIINGIIKKNILQPHELIISDPSVNLQQQIENNFKIKTCFNNQQVLENCEVIILAVKPQIFPLIKNDLKKSLNPNQIIISVMAGITIQQLYNIFQTNKIVRSIPNTPSIVNQGCIVWKMKDDSDKDVKQIAQLYLQSLGKEFNVSDEDFIDKATALTGSGPAYVLLFAESMIDSAVKLGFSRQVSQELVIQLFYGTSLMLNNDNKKSVTQFRHEVTSPNGTTAAGLAQFEKFRLRYLTDEAINAAYKKSLLLGQSAKL